MKITTAIIINLCLIICYDLTEFNELDSVKSQGRLKLMSSNHLLQKLMLREAIHNEIVIYTSNIIIGTLFLATIVPLTYLLSGKFVLYLPILILVAMFILLLLSNIISGKVDKRYDKKWLRDHENEIKKSAHDGEKPLKL